MKLTDFPRRVAPQAYEDLIRVTVDRVSRQDGVLSIFQIGSVSNPGISDLDFFVVFEDDSSCMFDPRDGLSADDRYLIKHGLFGATRRQFQEVQKYSFFHNYKLLRGVDLEYDDSPVNSDDVSALKRQIALEYLVKMYVDNVVEQTYGICRVRGLLLHIKGIRYDLEFLGIEQGRLFDLVEQGIRWRDEWFNNTPDRRQLHDWITEFMHAEREFLQDLLPGEPLLLPAQEEFRIAQNMIFTPADSFGYQHSGISLPAVFACLGRRYFNIQHRFNKFKFEIPAHSSETSDIVQSRFAFLKAMKEQNAARFPFFTPAVSSLVVV